MNSVETLEGLHTRARDLHDLARNAGTGSRRPHLLRSLTDGALSPFLSLPRGTRR